MPHNPIEFKTSIDLEREGLRNVCKSLGIPDNVIDSARRDVYPHLVPLFDSWGNRTPTCDIHGHAKTRKGLLFPYYMAKSAVVRSHEVWCGTSSEAIEKIADIPWTSLEYLCLVVLPWSDEDGCKKLVDRIHAACLRGTILVTASLGKFDETFISNYGKGLIDPQEVDTK